MTVAEMEKLIDGTNLTPEAPKDREVSCGYTCDLLSWVMAHGAAGMAWVTVQTHMNVIAVASLMEMAAVIIPEGIEMEEPSLQKARDEEINVLSTKLTAYEICARLAAAGLPGKERDA